MIFIEKDIDVFGCKVFGGATVKKHNTAKVLLMEHKDSSGGVIIPIIVESYYKTVDEFIAEINRLNKK